MKCRASCHIVVVWIACTINTCLGESTQSVSRRIKELELVPDFLRCVGPDFDTRWSDLRHRLLEYSSLRDSVYEDEDLNYMMREKLAEELVISTWQGDVTKLEDMFDQVVKRFLPPESLHGFCHQGLVIGLAIMGLGAARRGDHLDALKNLQFALDLLGTRLHLDYLESSGWHFTSALDLNVWIQQLGSLSDDWKGTEIRLHSFKDYHFPTPPALVSSAPRRGVTSCTKRPFRADLMACVFGVHSSLLMEPISMLRVLAPSLRTKVFMRDCPHNNAVQQHHCRLQCQVLGDCGDSTTDTARKMYIDIIHHFVDVMFHDGPTPRYFDFADLLSIISKMYASDISLQTADFYICTAPLMCSILRPFSRKPFLAYLGMQLHAKVDFQKDQLLLMHFQEMVKNTKENAWAVHNHAMREQIAFATGIRLDVVRPHCLYAFNASDRHAQLYTPYSRMHRIWSRLPERHRDVLFYRSKYFAVSTFVPMLDSFLEAFFVRESRPYPLQVVVVRNSSTFYSFDDIRKFGAAVLFPWDFALMGFYELYSLCGPVIYMPGKRWMWKIQQVTGWIWSDPIGSVELQGLRTAPGGEAFEHSFSPWWDFRTAPPQQLFYWYNYSDFARFPHVQRADSIPSLLWKLLDTDNQQPAARKGMLSYNAKTFRASLCWYRQKMSRLLTTFEGS